MEPSEREKELTIKLISSSGMVKLVCGVGNNIASLMLYDGIDAIKRTPKYRHLVKKLVNEIDKDFHAYELRLKHSNENRFFDMRDMSESNRSIYSKDMTNDDYYELWTSLCFHIYEEKKNHITCLQNKYYKLLKNHGVKYAEEYKYVMIALTSLEIATKMYQSAIDTCVDGYGLPRRLVNIIFSCFSLENITNKWRKMMNELLPEVMLVELNPDEEKDVNYGIEMLEKELYNLDNIFLSAKRAVEENEDFMRTKGTQKKVIREFADMRRDAQELLEYDRERTKAV